MTGSSGRRRGAPATIAPPAAATTAAVALLLVSLLTGAAAQSSRGATAASNGRRSNLVSASGGGGGSHGSHGSHGGSNEVATGGASLASFGGDHGKFECGCMEYWTCVTSGGEAYSYCGIDDSDVCCFVPRNAEPVGILPTPSR